MADTTPAVCMDPTIRFPSGWNPQRMLMKGRLTDKAIASYERRGYYAADYQEARREMWARKKAKRDARQGNFDIVDGRMIYNPG